MAFAYAAVSISSSASPASLAIHSVALFLLLSLAILFAHPECGLLAVVTSQSMGGTLARRLLPAAIVVPIVLGWLTMEGLRSGTLNTFVWLAVYAVSNLVVFAVVIWRTAGSLHATEQRRKAAEEALAREHSLLRLLLDNLPASIYVKDPEGRYLVYNAAAVHMVGVASEAVALGKTVFDFFPPEIARLYDADDRRLLATGQPVLDREEPTQDRDGNRRWFLTTKLPLRDSRGTTIGLLGISQDVTERKRAERALRESQQLLQAIIDNSTAVIYVKDLQGSYLMVNRRYEEIFHLTREAVLGKTDHDVFSQEAADAFRAMDQRVVAAGTALTEEEVAPHDDGPHTYISVKCPLWDNAGKPYAVFGISTDITERKRLEQQLLQSQRMEAVGRLAGGVAHDFNNLLTVIIGESELMLASLAPNDPLRAQIEAIDSSAQRAADLTRQLLAFSRKQVLQPKSARLEHHRYRFGKDVT